MYTIIIRVNFDVYDKKNGRILPGLSRGMKNSPYIKVIECENSEDVERKINNFVRENNILRAN